MKTNLDALNSEIQEYLKAHNLTVFHCVPRMAEPTEEVYWHTASHPDYREFLAAAEAAGVRLVTLHAKEFDADFIDDALERLEVIGLPRDERRTIEQNLKDARKYIGFTCQIELSFDLAPRVYIFDVRTPWFDALNDVLDSIDDFLDDDDDEPDEPLGGGYYSKN